jgi:hypothetical protein
MGKRFPKTDRTGRTVSGDKFVALRAALRQSDAWRSLSFSARAVLIEMMAGVHQANNGTVERSVRFLVDVVGCANSTVQSALRELMDRGFVVRTRGGCFGKDWQGQAALWRITEVGTMADPRPTKEYLAWRPDKNRKAYRDSVRTVPGNSTVGGVGVPGNSTGCTGKQHASPGFDPSRCTGKQHKSNLPGRALAGGEP